MTDTKRILITGAGGPLGVNVTRSLRLAPSPLFLLGTDCNRYHAPLALTDAVELIPPAKSTDLYVAALKELIQRYRIQMILPTHPGEVRAVTAALEHFPAVRTFLPAHRVAVTGDSKWETYRLLQAAGVPVPTTLFIDQPADVENAFASIASRPIWLRGSGTPGAGIGVASLPCHQAAHAQAWVDYHRGYGHFIASEFLPGRNLTWCGLFDHGELCVAQTRERLEYVIPHVSPSGITGAPAVTRTVVRADVRASSEAAVRALCAGCQSEVHGIYFVDLKEDAAGVPRVTEINAGRFGTTIHFYSAAGWNLPYLAVQLAFGEMPASLAKRPVLDPIPQDTYWLRTLDCGPVLTTEDRLPKPRAS